MLADKEQMNIWLLMLKHAVKSDWLPVRYSFAETGSHEQTQFERTVAFTLFWNRWRYFGCCHVLYRGVYLYACPKRITKTGSGPLAST